MTGHNVMYLHAMATIAHSTHPPRSGKQSIDVGLGKGHQESLAEAQHVEACSRALSRAVNKACHKARLPSRGVRELVTS